MEQEKKKKLFWLHIKKSAGISTRNMLSPLYVEVDREKRPACFVQSDRDEYNDILNNFRVVLGEYQFRRCLFAKKFLYPKNFDQYLRVAFSRQPSERCISQFFYLWHKPGARRNFRLRLSMTKMLRFRDSLSYDFDLFLDAVQQCRASPTNYFPYGLSFQTHTAAMWPDITDENQKCLLDMIFRLEDLEQGINQVRTLLGHQPLSGTEFVHTNKSKKIDFLPSKAQQKKIEFLFEKDFDIYEGMCENVG